MPYRVTFRGTYNSMRESLMRYNRELTEANYKVATGKEVNKPSDDPVAIVSILGSRRNLAALEQYQRNITMADNWLKTTDGVLANAEDILSRARELAEQMATGTYTAQNRADTAVEIEGLILNLISLANTKLGGNQIFAGDKILTTPFLDTFHIASPQAEATNARDYCGLVTAGGNYYHGHARTYVDFNGLGQHRVVADFQETSRNLALDYSGYFSFYYDDDGDFSGASEAADIFAFNQVTSTMSLEDIVSQINQGTAARGILTFDGSAASNDFIIIGSTIYEFVNSATAVTSQAGAVIISMGGSTMSQAAAISALLQVMNGLSNAATWAVQSNGAGDSNAIFIFARAAGSAGNSLTVRANTDLGSWTAAGVGYANLSATGVANGFNTSAIYSSLSLGLNDPGQFAFWYDYGSTGGSQDLADLFGLIDVTSGTTLASIAAEVNDGPAARGLFEITSALNSNTVVSIGNQTFEFLNSAGATGSVSGAQVISMGGATMSADAAMTALLNALNNIASADVWAVQSNAGTQSMYLFAKDTGTGGNLIRVSANTSYLELNGSTVNSGSLLTGGGASGWATASVVPTSHLGEHTGSGYVLRVTGAGSYALSFATTSTGGGYLASFGGVAGLNGGPAWVSSISASILSMAGGGSQWITADILSGSGVYQLRLTGEDSNVLPSQAHQVYLGGTSGPLALVSGAGLSFFSDNYDETSEWAGSNLPLLYVFADNEGSQYNSYSIRFDNPGVSNSPLQVEIVDYTVRVHLGTDSTGQVISTLGDVMRAVESTPEAARLIDVELRDGIASTTLAQPLGSTQLSGGQTGLSRRYIVEITTDGAVGGPRQAWLNAGISGADNDLRITALSAGTGGNSYRIRYLEGGSGVSTTTATITSNYDILVTLAVDDEGSNVLATAADVMAALNASAASAVSASLAPGNDGTGLMEGMSWAVLSGGAEQARFRVLEYAGGQLIEGDDDTYLASEDLTQIFDEVHGEYLGVKVAFSENGTTLRAGDKFDIDVGYYRGNEAQLKNTIGYTDSVQRNVTGTEMMGGAGDADNILDVMREFQVQLESNDQHGIQRSLEKLEQARQSLVTNQVSVGARINRLELRTNINTSFALTSQELLAETEGADLSDLIMELNMMETAYQATLTSISRISSLSLVDYL